MMIFMMPKVLHLHHLTIMKIQEQFITQLDLIEMEMKILLKVKGLILHGHQNQALMEHILQVIILTFLQVQILHLLQME